MKRLIQIDNGKILRQISLEKNRYSLGRGTDNDIVFEAGKISRKHAFLVKKGSDYHIVDNESSNHVYVNDEMVNTRKLQSGDRINLSRQVTLLYFSESDSDEKVQYFLKQMWEMVNKKDFLQLKEVTARIISLDSLDNILNLILNEIINLVGAERGFISLVDENGEILSDKSVTCNIVIDKDSRNKSIFSHSVVKRVVKNKEKIFILNTEDSEDDMSKSIIELELRSIMCAPLLFTGKLVGILYVDAPYKLTDFTEIDQFFFSIFADHAAIAIENAKLYENMQKRNYQLREEIRESEERYRQLVELSPDGIIVHSEDKVVFANTTAYKLLSYGDEEIIGKSAFEFIHPQDREIVGERIEKSFADGQSPPIIEEKFVTQDGKEVAVEVAAAPLSYQGKQAMLVVFRDISDKKKMEEERSRIQKLESLGILAGGIAHDFNNILTAIIGNLSLAKLNLDKEDENYSYLAEAEKASLRSKDLAQQLLTFSKGGVPIKKIGFINDMLKDSADFALRGTNIKCEYGIPHDLWAVEVDEGQISRVINNLVMNAQQAMPAGGNIMLKASNERIDDNKLPLEKGDYVKISIEDRGVGIPENILSKIFDPYFSTKQKGSGLGLTICYSIISKHGGYISAKSKPGEGTAVFFYLPAKPEKTPDGKSDKVEIKAGKGKVLLMDDEDIILKVTGRMLELIGYEPCFAKNGKEAVEYYLDAYNNGHPYYAVIMDLTIPGGMGGTEAVKKLLEIDPEVRAIVSSGYSNDPIMASFSDYGFKGFLAKPYRINELGGILEGLTGK